MVTTSPLFSILHSSARPDRWRRVYDDWISSAANPDQVEYVLCVDHRWGFAENLPTDKTGHQIFGLREIDKLVWNTGRRCYVDGVNTAAAASTGLILIVNADDQFAFPGWDARLWSACDPRDGGFVVEVSTGTPQEHERGIMVMPVLSRSRYLTKGRQVFYPAYESMYADNDFLEHAVQDGVVIDARHLPMFPHRHPIASSVPMSTSDNPTWDQAYAAQNRPEAYELGAKIFTWRRRVHFGDELERAASIPEGGTLPEELETLSFWASQMDSVVELGSWIGRSTRALCAGTAGLVTAVDTFTGSIDEPDMLQMVKDRGGSVLDQFRANTQGLTDLVYYVGDSAETAADFAENSVDMVFIDGGHSYEQVKRDLLAWIPKTRKLICGHDYAADCPGVVRAVDEIIGPPKRAAGRLWYRDITLFSVATLGSSGLGFTAAEHRVASLDAEVALRGVPLSRTLRGSIALALPGEWFSGLWVAKLFEIVMHLLTEGYNFSVIINYTSNAGITRQTIAQQVDALAPGFKPDYILWIDDDQIVEAGMVDMLITDLEALPDVDMIAGWTWISSSGAHVNQPQVSCGRMNLERGELSHADYRSLQTANGVFEVHWTGFPLVLMRPDAIKKAGKHPFAHYPCPESPWGECGEDISFCKRLRDAGGKVYVDSRAFVPHLKQKALGPSPDSADEIALALSGRTGSNGGFRVFEPAVDRGPWIAHQTWGGSTDTVSAPPATVTVGDGRFPTVQEILLREQLEREREAARLRGAFM